MRQLQINTNTIYISPYATNQGLNSTIAEIGHELIHALISQKHPDLNMNMTTQDYLAKIFQAQIWDALGNQDISKQYAKTGR